MNDDICPRCEGWYYDRDCPRCTLTAALADARARVARLASLALTLLQHGHAARAQVEADWEWATASRGGLTPASPEGEAP